MEEFDVRGAVVTGQREAVIWDTLARPEDMRGVAELAGRLPTTVIYSHGDWDHVWGTAGLSRPWQAVVAHRACGPRFDEELPRTLSERRAATPGEYDEVRIVPPTHLFSETMTLDLGGIRLELHSLPGHTPDSVVAFIPEWGTLLAGDAVESPLPFLNPGSPLAGWARGLEDWWAILDGWGEDRDASPGSTVRGEEGGGGQPMVIPSHGRLGGPELLLDTSRYLRALDEGRDPELPLELSPFYRETHAANRVLAREG
jgi:glyoxylase-like metal-dependent hydrolase (beta-lactamase superfamily II)